MLLLTLCLLAPPELAPQPRPAPTPAEKLKAAQDDFTRQQAAVRKRYDDSPKTTADNQRWIAEEAETLRVATVTATALAEADPGSAVGLDALGWAISLRYNGQPNASTPARFRAYDLFTAQYAAVHPQAGRVAAAALKFDPNGLPADAAAAVHRLITAVEKNPDRSARGQAILARARWATQRFRSAEENSRYDAATLATPMDALFDRLEKEFGDCPDVGFWDRDKRGQTLGKTVADLRPQVRIDRPAPPTVGVDLDGKPLDLAEFKGKVVLLVPWRGKGAALGKESLRAVGERYAGRPFAVVGLNIRITPAVERAEWEAAAPGWRSLTEALARDPGPLARTWSAQLDWSRAVVIDHQGVVRDHRMYFVSNRRGGGPAEPRWPVVLLNELVDAAEGKRPPTPAEQLAAVVERGKALEGRFQLEKQAAKTHSAVEQAYADHSARREEWMSQAVRLLRKYPAEPAAFDLIANHDLYVPAEERIALLKAHHWANPGMDSLVYGMAQGDPAERTFCDEVCESHPVREVRGRACLDSGRIARIYLLAEDKPRGFRKIGTRDELLARAEKYLKLAAEKYADVPGRTGGTVGELAAGKLAGLKNLTALAVGGTAPELAGEDLDGKPLKLGEYRNGRVAVVVFWGSWCGPCMRMVPKERALVEKYDAKDFCVFGVNGRDEKPAATTAAEKSKMLWPSVWDGGKAGGSLAAAWNVQAWPTIWVIDRGGVVRYVGHGDDLEKAVEAAVGTKP